MKKFQALQTKRQFISGKTVVGVDPAKDKHQGAILDPSGLQVGNPFMFAHDYRGFKHTLWHKISKYLVDCNPKDVVFAVETSCNLWQKLCYYLDSLGYTVLLVSPLTTKHSRPFFNHDFSRTDPKDALLMASNARDGYFDFYQTYTENINAMHQLSITYDKLRKNYVQQRTRLRAFVELVFPEFLSVLTLRSDTARYLLRKYFLPQHFLELDIEAESKEIERISGKQHGRETLLQLRRLAPNSIGIPKEPVEIGPARVTLDSWLILLEHTENQMEAVMAELVPLARQTRYFEILTSLKGISEKLAALFIAETRDLALYNHYKKLEKNAGLNLRQSQSGQYVGTRRISHIGNKRLCWIVYRMTEETAKYIPEVRLKFLRRQIKRPNYTKNLIASAPMLLKLISSLVKGNRKYQYHPEMVAQLKQLEQWYQELKARRCRGKKAA